MNPTERNRMLANLWAQGIYPEAGDVAALSIEMSGDNDIDIGLGICGQADLEQLIDLLLESLVGQRLSAPHWLALTQTCYFDTADDVDHLPQQHLQLAPTPTTRHGLLVVSVDDDGIHTTGWQIDLKDHIELPDEPVWEASEDAVAPTDLATTLYATYVALCMVAGGQ
jgi:hypothetical protein